ncbi:hypothetical protein GF406_23230 [candidate division KSB1 bacterium]|nr:hypothetical protein [candidate division KSB1 bacterium]
MDIGDRLKKWGYGEFYEIKLYMSFPQQQAVADYLRGRHPCGRRDPWLRAGVVDDTSHPTLAMDNLLSIRVRALIPRLVPLGTQYL